MRNHSLLCVLLLLGAYPATAQTAADKPVEKKVEKKSGIEVARPDGRWLGITTTGNQFKVTFYDQNKKLEPADVMRGTARWDHPRKRTDVNTVLNPSGANALATPTVLKPPYVYIVRFVLIGADEKSKSPTRFS